MDKFYTYYCKCGVSFATTKKLKRCIICKKGKVRRVIQGVSKEGR